MDKVMKNPREYGVRPASRKSLGGTKFDATAFAEVTEMTGVENKQVRPVIAIMQHQHTVAHIASNMNFAFSPPESAAREEK